VRHWRTRIAGVKSVTRLRDDDYVPLRRGGIHPLADFETELGLPAGFCNRDFNESEDAVRDAIHFLEVERPANQNYWPGLCLAMVGFAEELLAAAGDESLERPLDIYPPETQYAAGGPVNTLNVKVGESEIKLRRLYNHAAVVIRVEMRRQHPQMPGHATQAWPAYRPFLDAVCAATREGRRAIAEYIWERGVLNAQENVPTVGRGALIRPFSRLLEIFPTTHRPGGAVFQAMAFGYLRADSPNVILESHAVNVASRRAGVVGDVDGFQGAEIELAAEVKDLDIGQDNFENQLGGFLQAVEEVPNATTLVIARTFDTWSKNRLLDLGTLPVD
jgi:hypothetical protein